MSGNTAPEQSDRLEQQWAGMPEPLRRELYWLWTDHAVRKVLPSVCERFGRHDEAIQLRLLPRVADEAALAIAQAVVSKLFKKTMKSELNLGVSFLNVLTDIEWPVRFNLKAACFMMVMLSRSAFGDDRLVPVMERQIAERVAAVC